MLLVSDKPISHSPERWDESTVTVSSHPIALGDVKLALTILIAALSTLMLLLM